MASNFAAQVADWVAKSERNMLGVVKESADRVIAVAQTVGPSVASGGSAGEGGKMPVDTGWLRNSMKASLTGIPSGPGKGDPKGSYSYDPAGVTLTIAGTKIGDTIYAGWTANYAVFMEFKYGFQRSAAQQWQGIVTQVVAELRARS